LVDRNFKTDQNNKILLLICHTSYEFQTKNCLKLNWLRFQSHLQPSSRPRELYTKIHKRGLNHGIMTYLSSLTLIICIFVYSSLGREDGSRCDRNTYR